MDHDLASLKEAINRRNENQAARPEFGHTGQNSSAESARQNRKLLIKK
jgi:hypothetical protein